jgi:hypothetical protein
MKRYQFILPLVIVLFFTGFKPRTNPVYINGHLKKNPQDNPGSLEKLHVFVKGDDKVLAKTTADEKGNFELTFTPGKEKSFDFFCSGLTTDTLLIGSVQAFKSDTPDMVFYIPASRKKNASGHIICLKCCKADKVYKIAYGDGIPDRFDDDKTIPNANPDIINGEYQARTCIVGAAKYYCDRDKVKF